MDFRKQKLSIEEVKATDMVNYLSSIGYEPAKIRNNDYWYLSPFRKEKTASFKINRTLNRWYDHGLGKGGSLIDFAILYDGCSVGEFLEKMNTTFLQTPAVRPVEIKAEQGQKINVLGHFQLTSLALLRYLEQRQIPVEVADEYCREVRYALNDKTYYGIGFKNNSGGFEIRNPYFKASSSPKDITTYKNGSDEVVVFEGFFDFLSFKTVYKNHPENTHDVVVLNTISFFEKARAFMEQHQAIRLYLDNDTAGQNCSQYALSLSPRYTDESPLYAPYKDLNEWLVREGKSRKQHIGNPLG